MSNTYAGATCKDNTLCKHKNYADECESCKNFKSVRKQDILTFEKVCDFIKRMNKNQQDGFVHVDVLACAIKKIFREISSLKENQYCDVHAKAALECAEYIVKESLGALEEKE